jgi:predicted CXXCH cytochrome family protein
VSTGGDQPREPAGTRAAAGRRRERRVSKSIAITLPLVAVMLFGQEAPQQDPLATLGMHVTAGAAPGYVDDRVCSTCHAEIYRSYQQVGMARSFFRPRREKIIEDLGKQFVHARSKQIFEMVWRDDRLVFRRYQQGPDGKPVNTLEQPVDWILGSGQHARVYVYQTPDGELYQLPIAWYSQTKSWGMAPGYDRPDHDGVTRRVRHECMFCHNAYPEIAENRDGFWRSQAFPRQLPEGTGCQRCHGPGASHARAMFRLKDDQAAATIVNPARLSARQRNDVCYECHLLPAVAVQGARRLGRDLYSFRPGQALADYELPVDANASDVAPADRFEISHHAYRLEQSRCFRESNQRLSCLSCHDPHRQVPPEERAAHFRKVCLGCHETTVCSGQQHASGGREHADCVACHMQPRRTQDVVHVVMTDHRIARPVDPKKLLAPLEEQEPLVERVGFYDASSAPKGEEGELYRLLPLLRGGRDRDPKILARFEQALAVAKPRELEPLLDLANAQANQRQWSKLDATAQLIIERVPAHPLALAWLGLARGGLGKNEEAVALLRRAVSLAPERTGLHVQLALALLRQGSEDDAIAELERATTLRPNLVAAYLELGRIRARRSEPALAVSSYQRALAIEPASTAAYVGLGRALLAIGDRAGARRLWQHALEAASDRAAIEKVLPEAAGASGPDPKR